MLIVLLVEHEINKKQAAMAFLMLNICKVVMIKIGQDIIQICHNGA